MGDYDDLKFKEAFNKAYKEKGAGKTFTWKGRSYLLEMADSAKPMVKRDQNFSDAFTEALQTTGEGSKFKWRGKEYLVELAGKPKPPTPTKPAEVETPSATNETEPIFQPQQPLNLNVPVEAQATGSPTTPTAESYFRTPTSYTTTQSQPQQPTNYPTQQAQPQQPFSAVEQGVATGQPTQVKEDKGYFAMYEPVQTQEEASNGLNLHMGDGRGVASGMPSQINPTEYFKPYEQGAFTPAPIEPQQPLNLNVPIEAQGTNKIPYVNTGESYFAWSKNPDEVAQSNATLEQEADAGNIEINKDSVDENGNFSYKILTDEYKKKFNDWIDGLNTPKEPAKQDDGSSIENAVGSVADFFGGIGEGISDSVERAKGDLSNVFGAVNKYGDELSQYPEKLYNTAANYAELGYNGISRKIKFATGDDSESTVSTKTVDPLNVKDYYAKYNSDGFSQPYEVKDSNGRMYKSAKQNIDNITFGYRNRGDYKEFESDGLDVTMFNPFQKPSQLKLGDENTVVGVDTKGKLVKGSFKDFKNRDDVFVARTFRNKVVSFDEKDNISNTKNDAEHNNKNFQVPLINVLENGKTKKGSLNLLLKPGEEDFYGSVQGGRVLMENPDTKKTYLVSGSLREIKDRFKEIKGDSKYVEVYTLDNGTYSRGLSFNDKKFTKDRLKSYDNENTAGGNGLYIINSSKPATKFKTEFYETPNVRTKEDDSYKKGNSLKNKAKNIVLHYTAYEDAKDSDKKLHDQFMKKGENSAHVVILKDGTKRIYASPEQVSFHAGKSKWKGIEEVNNYGIGIEFQNNGKSDLSKEQVESGAEYIEEMMKRYNIPLSEVVSHEMIAPGRKFDLNKKQFKQVIDYLKNVKKVEGGVKKFQDGGMSTFDLIRPDGTPKGEGYFGRLKADDGRDMTEFSETREWDGKEHLIPTITPGLTPKQLAYLKSLRTGEKNTDKEISDNALRYAYLREDQGQPFFATKQEEGMLPPPVSSNGLYDYPNQSVIVPTKSGNITMEGIDYPVTGKSLETGEEKLMRPNGYYNFKNTKHVLEIPKKK